MGFGVWGLVFRDWSKELGVKHREIYAGRVKGFRVWG